MIKRKESGLRPRRRRRASILNRRFFTLTCILLTAVIIFVTQQQPDLAPIDGEIRVHFIDVGQGESILVQSANHAVLIDAGPLVASQNLIVYLEKWGIRALDYVVATHPHSDHIGGMSRVLDRFFVHELWMPDVSHDTATFEQFLDAIERNNLEITTVQAGDILSAGPIRMTVVAPNRSGYGNLNDYSIVLHMQYGHTSFLFTGDAETLSENEMIAAGWNLQADILNVGHHGSRTSSSESFLDAVYPQVAVISLAADNQFGHPHPEVLDRFARRDIEVLRTDELGTIVMSTNGDFIYLY